VSDDYENILNDLMPDDLHVGISSMHLSGKLFQMINNKNKTMIVEMKAPSNSIIPSACFFFLHYPACILAGKKFAKTEMR
jgi:hypothetical protein